MYDLPEAKDREVDRLSVLEKYTIIEFISLMHVMSSCIMLELVPTV